MVIFRQCQDSETMNRLSEPTPVARINPSAAAAIGVGKQRRIERLLFNGRRGCQAQPAS
jgi:hypothetical protein